MQTFNSVSRLSRKLSNLLPFASTFQLRIATLVVLAMTGLLSALAIAWLFGEKTIVEVVYQLEVLQTNPPFWLEVPDFNHPFYLYLPTLIFFVITWIVMKLSPQQKTWSRVIMVSILLALTIRYLLWRSLSTLNLDTPLNGIFSIALLGMELLFIFSSCVQLYLVLKIKDRRRQADFLSSSVVEGDFTPSVDIFIPTYNEPAFILKRTIIGCQALLYPHKTIYVLDDGRRAEIQQLARELGCQYITRPDNIHAKAGNLNNALKQTSGELIAVFDADFIPTTNFLQRTVGFFQDIKMALVQTNQNFYNTDPIARNLGLENILTEEVEIFSRYYQPIRDGIATTVCYGSSFVVRRSYLEEVGEFVTDSLSEDYFTGIRLVAQGYHFIYLDEKLSSGLAAENMAAHILQRLRWSRGTLQAFFIDSNPLTIPGLSLMQRLAHLEGLSQWIACIPRSFFLLIPILITFFKVIPVQVTFAESLYFFVPYYLISLSTFAWLNKRSRSAILSDLYSVVQCFPLAMNAIQVMLNPFSQGFQVTPKGLTHTRYVFNWKLALPLIIILLLTLFSFGYNLSFLIQNNANLFSSNDYLQLSEFLLTFFWSCYNILILSIAILIMVDAPKPNLYEWFDLQKIVRLTDGKQVIEGVSMKLSEIGAIVELKSLPTSLSNIQLEILGEGLILSGKVVEVDRAYKHPKIKIEFENINLIQQRQLIELLYCRFGQWKLKKTPGEWHSLWLLIRQLLRPLKFSFKKQKNLKQSF